MIKFIMITDLEKLVSTLSMPEYLRGACEDSVRDEASSMRGRGGVSSNDLQKLAGCYRHGRRITDNDYKITEEILMWKSHHDEYVEWYTQQKSKLVFAELGT